MLPFCPCTHVITQALTSTRLLFSSVILPILVTHEWICASCAQQTFSPYIKKPPADKCSVGYFGCRIARQISIVVVLPCHI